MEINEKRSYRPNLEDMDPEVQVESPSAGALYQASIVAEHQSLSENFDEFNPQEKPWIWQLPEDRDILIDELVKLRKEKVCDFPVGRRNSD